MSRARQIADFGDGIATADIDDGAVTAAKINSGVALGVTEADHWRLTTNYTTGSDDQGTDIVLTSNLERADTDGAGKIGTGVSESSGVFSFPSTGVWKIDYSLTGFNTTVTTRIVSARIFSTTNNSNYNLAALSTGSHHSESSSVFATATTSFIFDVTDTSTHKLKFGFNVTGSNFFSIVGDTGYSSTSMTFTRLGDT